MVAAVSPTLFAEAPGTIIYKVRAGDTVKAGDVLGTVESAALTNEYERERATLASPDAALNRQTIEVRRQILKSSQDTDLAKVQITAAEREFKRAEDAWDIHVIPERDFERARDDLETAKLNYAHAIETGGLEKDSLQLELRSQRAQRDAQALRSRACATRGRTHAEVAGGRHGRDAQRSRTRPGRRERAAGHRGRPHGARNRIPGRRDLRQRDPAGHERRDRARRPPVHRARSPASRPTCAMPRSPAACASREQPKGLRQNQRASVRIVLDERNDVLKVARSPFSDSDTRFVYVVRDDAAVRTPVEFGAAAIGEIEIRNGLKSATPSCSPTCATSRTRPASSSVTKRNRSPCFP